MWVLNLGGSLERKGTLKDWLAALLPLREAEVLVVPGGGRFADAVRASQADWGYPDAAAHGLAMQAMAQTARVMQALEPRFTLVPAPAASAPGEPASIWCPTPEVAADAGLPGTWSLTSDSLSAWAAARIGARRLVLVKSLPEAAIPASVPELSARGIVDPMFADYLAAAGAACWCLSAELPSVLPRLLEGSGPAPVSAAG